MGRFIGVTESFACSSPSKSGDDCSAHILVLAAQCPDLPVFETMPARVKIEPGDTLRAPGTILCGADSVWTMFDQEPGALASMVPAVAPGLIALAVTRLSARSAAGLRTSAATPALSAP